MWGTETGLRAIRKCGIDPDDQFPVRPLFQRPLNSKSRREPDRGLPEALRILFTSPPIRLAVAR